MGWFPPTAKFDWSKSSLILKINLQIAQTL